MVAALVALALLAVSAAPAGAGAARPKAHGLPLPHRLQPHGGRLSKVDWAQVAKNSAQVRAAEAAQQAQAQPVDTSAEIGPALSEARARLGGAPSTWDRLDLPEALTAEQRDSVRGAVSELRGAAETTARAVAEQQAKVEGALKRLPPSSRRDQAERDAQAQAQVLEDRAGALRRAAQDIEEGAELESGSFTDRVQALGRRLEGRDPATELDALTTELRSWGEVRDPEILGAALTYVKGGLSAPPMPDGGINPAYLVPDSAPPLGLEDAGGGTEIVLAPDLVAEAQSLGTTQAALEYVKNSFRLDWYSGCEKDSEETLHEGRGNDVDLAGLLVALLTAQGTNARYVQGTIQLSLPRLADLMGLLSAADEQALYGVGAGVDGGAGGADGGTASAPFQLSPTQSALVLQALGSADIAYTPIAAGGQVASVQLVHTWVEAFIPYADYRGAGTSVEGKQWVPLEPTFTGRGKYVATEPAVDGFAALGADAGALTAGYLAMPLSASMLEYTEAVAEGSLPSGTTFAQTLRGVAQQPEVLSLIPGALPYQVISVQGEYDFLPDSAKHHFRLTAQDGTGTLLDLTVPLHQLTGHRTTFTFQPATATDAELLLTSGGPYVAPAAAVQVVLAFRVDGVVQAAATRSVGLGTGFSWTATLELPDGTTRQIQNPGIAGNLIAVGVGGPTNGHLEPSPQRASDLDGPAPVFLYGQAVTYANAWTASEEELAEFVDVVPVRPTANVVFVENQLQVDTVAGIPSQLVWEGLEVDADWRTMVPLELKPGRGAALLLLSGYEGSYQEQAVLQAGTQEPSISAVGVIQQAHAQGVPVVTLTAANDATLLAAVDAPAAVIADVQNQLAQGRTVMIPEAELTLQNWTGTGYISLDPATEEGGYFLSGIVSGGETIVSPNLWADQSLVNQLMQASAPPPTTDVTQIAQVLIVPSCGLQATVVGTPAPSPLQVYVLTAKQQPVKGATVTFSALPGGQPAFADTEQDLLSELAAAPTTPPLPTIQAMTNAQGLAQVFAAPDPIIGHGAAEIQPGQQIQVGQTNPGPAAELVGVSQVLAAAGNGSGQVQTAAPMIVLGLPAAPTTVTVDSVLQNEGFEEGLDTGILYTAAASDRFGNAVPNVAINWTQELCAGGGGLLCGSPQPATGAFFDPFAAQYPFPPGDPFAIPAEPPLTNHVLNGSSSPSFDPAQLSTLTELTSEAGEVETGYILGMEPDPSNLELFLIASLAQAPTSTGTYSVFLFDPTAVVTLRLADAFVSSGIDNTLSPEQWVVTMWIYRPDGWAIVEPGAPELTSAVAYLNGTAGSATGQTGPTGTGNSLFPDLTQDLLNPNPATPNVAPNPASFRTPYVLANGYEHIITSALVQTSGAKFGDTNIEYYFDGEYYFSDPDPVSGTVITSVSRVDPTETVTPLNGQPALSTDLALQYNVSQPSSQPIYFSVTPTPVSGAPATDTVVQIPNASQLPQLSATALAAINSENPTRPLLNLIQVNANSSVTLNAGGTLTFDQQAFDLPIVSGTVGGTVTFTVYAPDSDHQVPCNPSGGDIETTADQYGRTCLRSEGSVVVAVETFGLHPLHTNENYKQFPGVFVATNPPTTRDPTPDDMKAFMVPIRITGSCESETLAWAPGGSGSFSIYQVDSLPDGSDPQLLTLPVTWTVTPPPPGLLALGSAQLGVPGVPGTSSLELSCTNNGAATQTDSVTLRGALFPGSIGDQLPAPAGPTGETSPPFLWPRRTFNINTPVLSILDPGRHAEMTNQTVDVFVVPHRDLESWQGDPQLEDVRGEPNTYTFNSTPFAPNMLDLSVATMADGISLASYVARQGETALDVVYSFRDPDQRSPRSTLVPGDILDLKTQDEAGVPGALPSITVEPGFGAAPVLPRIAYSGGTVHANAGFDGLQDSYEFHINGEVTLPNNAAPGSALPLAIILHGNHTPEQFDVNPTIMGSPGPYMASNGLTSAPNFEGYTYLQDALGAAGWASISVNLDDLCGVTALGWPGPTFLPFANYVGTSGIRLRAWLALETLRMLLTSPGTLNGALAGLSFDPTRLIAIGHSRGGEAVTQIPYAIANNDFPGGSPLAASNSLAGLTLAGIVALAPTSSLLDAQSSASTWAPISVPFMLIDSSNDGDVNGLLPGARFYELFDAATGRKFEVRELGGNHNWFSTSWPFDEGISQLGATPFIAPTPFANAAVVSSTNTFSTVTPTAEQASATGYVMSFVGGVVGGDDALVNYLTVRPGVLFPNLNPGPQTTTQAEQPSLAEFVLDNEQGGGGSGLSSSMGAVTCAASACQNVSLPPQIFGDWGNAELVASQGSSVYGEQVTGGNLLQDARIRIRIAQVPSASPSQNPVEIDIGSSDSSGEIGGVSLGAFYDVSPVAVFNAVVPCAQSSGGCPQNYTHAAFQSLSVPVQLFEPNLVQDTPLGEISFGLRMAGAVGNGQFGVAIDAIELQ